MHMWNFNRRLLFSFSRMTGAFLIFRRIYLNVFKAVKQSVTTRGEEGVSITVLTVRTDSLEVNSTVWTGTCRLPPWIK